MDMECSEIGCNMQKYVKGLCQKHYNHQKYVQFRDTHEPKDYPSKKSSIKRKIRSFEKLGNQCNICGEKPDWTLKIINLQFHHLDYGEGRTEHIREIDSGGKASARRVKEVERYPERFQLLCFECHKMVGIAKTSPHKISACAKHIASLSR